MNLVHDQVLPAMVIRRWVTPSGPVANRLPADAQIILFSRGTLAGRRYDTKLWMRDLMEGAAYLPK